MNKKKNVKQTIEQPEQQAEQTETAVEKPKRLSKAAEFMKNYPNGMGVIVDMKAVMK